MLNFGRVYLHISIEVVAFASTHTLFQISLARMAPGFKNSINQVKRMKVNKGSHTSLTCHACSAESHQHRQSTTTQTSPKLPPPKHHTTTTKTARPKELLAGWCTQKFQFGQETGGPADIL